MTVLQLQGGRDGFVGPQYRRFKMMLMCSNVISPLTGGETISLIRDQLISIFPKTRERERKREPVASPRGGKFPVQPCFISHFHISLSLTLSISILSCHQKKIRGYPRG